MSKIVRTAIITLAVEIEKPMTDEQIAGEACRRLCMHADIQDANHVVAHEGFATGGYFKEGFPLHGNVVPLKDYTPAKKRSFRDILFGRG